MDIFANWRDSLLVFARRDAALFWAAVLSKLGQIYKQLFCYVSWWLIPIMGIYAGFYFRFVHGSMSHWPFLSAELLNLGLYIVLFFCLVAAWPSVERKNACYYVSSLAYFIPFYLGLLLVRPWFALPSGRGFAVLGTEALPLEHGSWLQRMIGILTTIAVPPYVAPLACFFGFFYLDSENINGAGTMPFSWLIKMPVRVFKSWLRALMLLFATLPLCIILSLVFTYTVAWGYQVLSLRLYAIDWFGSFALDIAGYSEAWALASSIAARAIDMLCAMLLWPIAVAPYAVIYSKWVHERYALFFRQT